MEERITRDRIARESMAAVACFAAAVLSIAIGFVFTTSLFLDADLHPLLRDVGVVLLIVGIPILILGGHFMDLRERRVNRGNRGEAVNSR